MIDTGTVTSATANGIATIRFGHPKSNSLPGALLARLADAVRTAGADPEVRVIILESEGDKAFCAGASFAELQAVTDAEGGKRFFMGFATLILAMIRCPKFIITRVQGKVVGGGIGLVAASDYAIATSAAAVRLSELQVGIGPFVVGPVIERKVGLAAFSTMAVNAFDWRDAAWAERQGLYASVHATAADVDAAVQQLARQLSESNPEAMAQLKKVFWQGTEAWDALLAERAAMSGTLVLSDFTRQMLAAR